MKKLLSIPEKFYKNIKPAVSVVSKPQSEHLLRYVTGLVISSNKTIEGITEVSMISKDQSSLNRFLTEAPWKHEKVRNAALNTAKRCRLLGQGCIFVVDDSLAEKRGKHFAGSGWFHDHNSGRTIWGNQIVTSGYITPKGFIPFDADLYIKQEDCHQDEFLTKNKRACNLLDAAHKTQPFNMVVIDTWYANNVVLGHCQERSWDYTTQLKSNRKFMHNNKSWRMDEYAAKLAEEDCLSATVKSKRYQLHGADVHLNGIGDHQLVVVRRWNSKKKRWGKWHFLLTSLRLAEPETVLRLYLRRWDIERFHEVAKQELGLGKYRTRKRRGIVRHLFLVMLAYLLVFLWAMQSIPHSGEMSMEERIRSFRKACERIVVKTGFALAQNIGAEKALNAIGLEICKT